jgi:DNA-binding CsgD family transcriptional regulator
MNKQQFQEVLEKKFKKARAEIEVLHLVLNGLNSAEIAQLRKRHEGTIRNQISKIYKKFGIKSEFLGDKPQIDQLKDLFRQYKPDWVNNDLSSSTHDKSNQLETINNNDVISIVPEVAEDLMSFAINVLEHIGFDELFNMKKGLDVVGYRLKSPKTADKRYQIFIESYSKLGLRVSINKDILEPYLLNLKYWLYIDESWCDKIAAQLLIIPRREKLFLAALDPKYWNIFEVEAKTVGDVYLNDKENPEYYDQTTGKITQKCLDGFSKQKLSDRESYLVIHENQEFNFNYTWKMLINSKEVLKDFLVYFGKILMEIQWYETSDNDDENF